MDRILTSAVSLAVAVSTLTQEALTVAALRARGRKEPVTLQVGRKDYITREIAVHPTKGECRRSPARDDRPAPAWCLPPARRCLSGIRARRQRHMGAVPSLGRGCSQPVIASRELTRIFT